MGKNEGQNFHDTADLFKAVFDSAPNGIAVMQTLYDENGRAEDFEILLFNAYTFKWIGDKEYKGKRYSDVFPKVKETGILEKFKHVAETGVVADFESWYAGEGLSHWFHFTAVKQGELLVVTTDDITEQKKAEEALTAAFQKTEQQQRLYDSVTNNTPDLIYVFDLAYRFTYANEALLKMWGKPAEEAIGKGLRENGYEEWHAAMHEREIDEVVATKTSIRGTVSFPHAELGKRIYDYIFAPVFNKQGDVEAIAGTTRDISDIKQSEEIIKERETQLHFAIDATELGVWDYNPITGTFRANARLKEWFGLHAEEEVDLALAIAVIAEADQQRVTEAIQKAMEWGSGDYEIEYSITNPKTGERKIVRAKGKASFNDEKKASRFNGTLQDVTAQALARKQIEESEEHLSNIISQINAGLAQTSINGAFTDANERFCQITGYTLEELRLLTIENITHPEDWPRNKTLFTKALTEGKNFFIEKRYIRKDGSLVWVNNSVSVVTDSKGKKFITAVSVEITEEITSRRKLEESESRFRNLVRDASVGIVVLTGSEMKVEIVNETYGQLIGRTAYELMGKNIFAVVPEAEDTFRPILERVRVSGEPLYFYDTAYAVKKDERAIEGFLNLVYQPYRSSAGEIIGVMVLCQDVSESVKAKKALEASEAKFRSVVSDAPVAISLFVGRDLVIESPNQSFVDIVGKGWSIVGKPLREAMPELITEGQPYLQILDDVFNSGKTFKTAGSLVKIVQNGVLTQRYYNFTYSPLFDSEGEVWALLDIAIDVTDQIEATQKVQESEERFRLLSDEMPQFVWTGDAAGHLSYFNQAVYAYSGLSREDITREGWIQIVHPDDRQENIRLWQQSIATGEDFIFEHRFKRADGEYRWQLSRAVPQRDAHGVIQQWIGTSTDIQDRKNLEERLEKLVAERTKELQRSNEDLQQFAHVASHDLKEPVRKIKTFTHRLEDHLNGSLDETATRFIERIHVASNRMHDMIEGVLKYSTMNAGTQRPQVVDLTEVVKSIETDLEVALQETGATLQYKNLPVVDGAPVLIYQLFYNVINNAIKFAKPDVPPRVKILSKAFEEDNKHFVSIMLQDNGIGFEPEQAMQIFESFSRLNPKDKYEGTGLGLSLCKKIVDRHGGSIIATGTPGEGATFIITLPVQQKQISI